MATMIIVAAAVSLAAMAWAGWVMAADWPPWRGPNRDGHVPAGERVLTNLPAKTKPRWSLCLFCLVALSAQRATLAAAPHAADWLRDARLGVFMHFLPGDSNALANVNDFDVPAVARQLKAMGAGYLVLTLGQNSGYFNSPNAVYDEFLGCAPGERCSRRDLPLDLYRALQPDGIRLMLYLPCQVPNGDARAQRAFGLPVGRKDQPINEEFARKWAKVIHEWSARYGDKVAGWWFDGGYQHIQFNEAIARIYADAVKRGNPQVIVTFNPGVRLVRHTRAEDYTAGELNEPFTVLPSSRWVDGAQWHALTYLGSNWGQRNVRYPDERWVEWVRAAVAKGGAVTLDLGPNWDPAAGPIGTFSDAQVAQVIAVRKALPDPRAGAVPSFFAFENCLNFPPAELAATLKELGCDGLSASGYDVVPLRKELEARGLKLYNTYLTPTFDAATPVLDEPLRKLIDDLQGSGAALWIAPQKVTKDGKAFAPSSPDGDEVALTRLREIADYAEPRGIKIALYPHTWFWLERVEDGMRLANKMNRPGVGATFNLCHWLKVEGNRDPVPVLTAALPRLFFVSINGADTGDTQKQDWNQLIQTLDRGSYDVAGFVQMLRTLGYTGPVGLQCYNLKGDPKENLQRSVAAWRRITSGVQ